MIILKSKREIEIMREGGTILYNILHDLLKEVKEGVESSYIDILAEKLMESYNVKPAFKGYRGYPYSVCVSINDEVIHGFPIKEKVFKEGDVVSIDIGIIYKGYYSDMAYTVPVGDVDDKKRKLLEIGEKILFQGISEAIIGNRIGNISNAIETNTLKNGYSVVKDFIGHGIGRKLHEEPEVPNFGSKDNGPILKDGMVIAIEPMICMGKGEVYVTNDGWTVKTKDREISVHFEHTVAITENGPLILTLPDEKNER
ncbi:MAG TPA: type I methionyl aminopeptidase [Caldisericia bacterium]|nr:type I methionyl aminopeptidase [Caldisericia bacterium]